MNTVIVVSQIVSAILLSVMILIQAKGSGLSATFGGGGEFYSSKRGAEKIISIATVVIAIAFVALSVASTLIN